MKLRISGVVVAGLGLAVFLLSATVLGAAAEAEIRFNRDVRPILSDNCFRCHGPDKTQRKAKLRLDDRDLAIERQAIVPGKPEESKLVERIYATSEDDVMPPPETHKQLTLAQKDVLRRWIAGGAKYEMHWAYIKPRRPELPQPKDAAWVRNPVDAFILHALEIRGIKPAPEADKQTLLRRLSLDLIGLPPAPRELASFAADRDSKAYERQVSRLLNSPHFGERMAAPWLDVVRFADTVGYHGDQNQNVFPYRDYIIDSFNKNKPFDRFTIEQLAGDLLPNSTVEQRVATGFNRLNMMTREGGAQPKEYLAKYAADRVRTVSTAWLGSTMGCAECHDHKYDPFTTQDFYQLAAFFSDIQQWGVYQDYNYTPNPDLKGWSNDHPFPPEEEVDSPYFHRRLEKLERQLADLFASAEVKLKSDAKEQAAYADWRQSSLAFLQRWPSGWAVPEPHVTILTKETNAPAQTNFVIHADGTILLGGKFQANFQIRLPLSSGWLSALRLELIPHEQHGGSIIQGGGENTPVTLLGRISTKDQGQETKLTFYHAEADPKEERYANGLTILGVKDVWRTSKQHRKSRHTALYLLDLPLRVDEGDSLILSLRSGAVGCVRVAFSPFATADPLNKSFAESFFKELKAAATNQASADGKLLQSVYLPSTGWDTGALAVFKQLYGEVLECRNGRSPTLVAVACPPRLTRVLPRGNWQDESGEIVQPSPPHFLPQAAGQEGDRLNRLDLARWLVSAENPLTARTLVNRLWKQFFGAGICSTVDDLGLQGDPPSHPELLDWLAVELQESGWNVKHMVELIVTSSAYRQDSNLRPELRETDPGNRLLACQNPRRLEAEFVRDNALFIAGLLNLEIGGPSALPYQPSGYYANLQFPDREYKPDRGDRQYRRGVYMHWQRAFLHPMLANFDAPSREECTAYRTVSNTPQQALTLLNDPTFVEAARVFAEAILDHEIRSDLERLDIAFHRALARSPRTKESQSLLSFLNQQRAHYAENPNEARRLLHVGLAPLREKADKVQLAAWTSVCRVILNLHETATIY